MVFVLAYHKLTQIACDSDGTIVIIMYNINRCFTQVGDARQWSHIPGIYHLGNITKVRSFYSQDDDKKVCPLYHWQKHSNTLLTEIVHYLCIEF